LLFELPPITLLEALVLCLEGVEPGFYDYCEDLFCTSFVKTGFLSVEGVCYRIPGFVSTTLLFLTTGLADLTDGAMDFF
jgi:hypothetical protein